MLFTLSNIEEKTVVDKILNVAHLIWRNETVVIESLVYRFVV